MLMNILVVDDKEANLYSLESLLQELKLDDEIELNILKALSGEEGLKIAMNEEIDLIILDIQMPGMNGFETAKFLKSNHKTKNIQIVFLTAAFKAEEFVKHGFEVGAIDYFTKPIEKHQFLNKIKLYLMLFSKNKKLGYLNDNLKSQVEKNVEAIREKDKMLFEQSRMAQLGEMIGNIAHQWRQPLSVITTASTGMKLRKGIGMLSDEEFITHCNSITKNANYLSQTIDDFKNFIKEKKELQSVDLQKKIKEVLSIVDSSLKNSSIHVIQEFEEEPVVVDLVSGEFTQVMMNILNNAKDILQETKRDKKWVKLCLKREGKYAIITIENNGESIEEKVLPKIFDPYFTTKHKMQGTGLGLYMSYKIIKALNGKLYAKNTQNGVKFFIYLPIV